MAESSGNSKDTKTTASKEAELPVPEIITAQPVPYPPQYNQVGPSTYMGPAGYMGPPAPGMQTMNHSTNVTIVQQPQQQRFVSNNWSTGLCECCSDVNICMMALCCYACLECKVATDLNESCCVPYCVPAWQIVLRTKVRTQRNISGSVMNDCCIVCCCPVLSLCQLAREAKIVKAEQYARPM